MVERIVREQSFIPPFSRFTLAPVGITHPLINPPYYKKDKINADPTSSKFFKKGHNLLFRSYATATDF